MFTHLFWVLPLTTVAIFVATFILIPMKNISFYKRQGATTYFFPVFGAVKRMLRDFESKNDLLASNRQFSKEYPNQKVLVTNQGRKTLVSLRDPKYVREFLQNPSNYEKDKSNLTLLPLAGCGLVFSEGDTWKRHRKIVSNSFNYDFLKSNTSLIRKTAQEFLDSIKPEEYDSYSAIAKIQEITGEVVGRIFFGENLKEYTFEGKTITLGLADLVGDIAIHTLSPWVLVFGAKILQVPFIPKYARLMRRVNDFRNLCAKIIKEKKATQEKGTDLLTSLIMTQKAEDPKLRFSDEDIIDEFITFFIAGMDTTGHLIGMTLYHLTQNTHLLSVLKEEREKIYNQEAEVTADGLQKMDFLHAVLKEALRFDTPAPATFGRVALVDHKLDDLVIKKGDVIQPSFLAMFFDEHHFESPEKFNPYRWISATRKADPYAYMPFSAGPRNCIGQHLAIMESKVILSEFLERFDFCIEDTYKLRMTFKFLYEPHEEIKLKLKPIVKEQTINLL